MRLNPALKRSQTSYRPAGLDAANTAVEAAIGSERDPDLVTPTDQDPLKLKGKCVEWVENAVLNEKWMDETAYLAAWVAKGL